MIRSFKHPYVTLNRSNTEQNNFVFAITKLGRSIKRAESNELHISTFDDFSELSDTYMYMFFHISDLMYDENDNAFIRCL